MAAQVVVELSAKDKVTPVLGKLKGGVEKVNSKLNSLSGTLARIGTAAVVKGFAEAGVEADRTAKRLKLLSGEYGETKAVQKLATEGAKKFTIGQTQAAKAVSDLYGRLRPAGVSLKGIETVFNGVGVAASKMNLTAEDTDAVMLQLSQALGEGVLNGENLSSVMGRLPSIGNAIAKSMGVSVGQLKKLGAQGKITSKEVVKGLANLANQKPPDADAYKQFNKGMKDLSTTMGTEFLPAITPIVQATASLVSAFGMLPGPVKTVIAAAAGLAAGIVVLTPIVATLIAGVKTLMALKLGATIAGWLLPLKAIAPLLLTVGKVLLGVFTGPVGWIALLAGAGAAIYAFRDQIGDALSGVGGFFRNALVSIGLMKPAFNKTAVEAEKINTATEQLAPKIDAATEAKNRHIEALKQSLEFSTKEKTQVEEQQAAYQNTVNVTNARLNAEKTINDLQGQILQRVYEQTDSAAERLAIAKRIFQNEMNGARITYEQTLNSIQAAKDQLEMKKKGIIVEGKMLEARGRIAVLEAKGAQAKKKAQVALDKAVATQAQAVRLINGQIKAQDKIAVFQKQSAEAQFKAKELTAKQNLEQKLVSKEVGLSKTEARRLADGLGNSLQHSRGLSTATGRVAVNAQRSATMFMRVAQNANQAAHQITHAANAQARLNALQRQAAGSRSVAAAAEGAYWAGGFKAFAQGGIVTKPTLGLVGEGGENEYIIPQSKMGTASANYLSGGRGAGILEGGGDNNRMPSINIQTGPVMQQGGETYLTIAQFEAGLRNLSESVARGGRSYGVRQFQGVS